jgi:hypothetical protein
VEPVNNNYTADEKSGGKDEVNHIIYVITSEAKQSPLKGILFVD